MTQEAEHETAAAPPHYNPIHAPAGAEPSRADEPNFAAVAAVAAAPANNRNRTATPYYRNPPWAAIPTPELHAIIHNQIPSFRRRPYLADVSRLEAMLAAGSLLELEGDYCWSLCFEERFVARLCYEGFLPICCDVGGSEMPGLYVLLPKLHEQRCVLLPPRLHISRKVRRRARRYILTVGRALPRVLHGCIAQHGVSWLYPPMQRLLLKLIAGCGVGGGHVRTVSFELWALPEGASAGEFRDDLRLVAGDLGCVVGSSYTSFSGFRCEDGAGSVQLALTARLLERAGFAWWDLGQEHTYKTDLGAELIPRADFIKRFHRTRDETTSTLDSNIAFTGNELMANDAQRAS